MRVILMLELPAHVGGGYQQSLSTILALRRHQRNHDFFVLTTVPENLPVLESLGVPCAVAPFTPWRWRLDRIANEWPVLRQIREHPRLQRLAERLRLRAGAKPIGWLDAEIDAHGGDLVFFLTQSELCLSLRRHAFVATIYDVCQRDQPEFPEVAYDGELDTRDQAYRAGVARAVAVVVSSERLAERVCRYYGADPARMVVLPLLPSPAFRSDDAAPVDVRAKYGLPGPYVFYPAQLWPHKNHRYILDGLRLLSDRHGVDLDAVFVGSDKGNGVFLRRKAYELGLAERVHFLGFVPHEDVPSLYAEAFAMVMPTYFGPTNIPPLEAFAAGRPVIYSDLADFRAEMGDAVLYCDLRSPGSLAEHLLALHRDPALADRLREAGRRVLARTDEPGYAATLAPVFDRYDQIRRRWTD